MMDLCGISFYFTFELLSYHLFLLSVKQKNVKFKQENTFL